MNTIGVAIHERGGDIIGRYNLKHIQLMTQDTKTGRLIWTPEMINNLRGDFPSIKLYSHAMFKVVLGRYYPTVDIFAEHYKYLCEMGFYGYVVHIPSNIEMDYCLEFVKKLFSKTKKVLGHVTPTVRVFFEHIPSEVYSLSSNMAKFGLKLKAMKLPLPVGLCIDTCHIYVSGISLEHKNDACLYIREVESAGLPILIHLNDSATDIGSFADRHAELGSRIWLKDKSGLRFIVNCEHEKIIELGDPISSLELIKNII